MFPFSLGPSFQDVLSGRVSHPCCYLHFEPDNSVLWGSFVHCRTSRSIPGLYPPEKCHSSCYDNQKCLQTLPNVL